VHLRVGHPICIANPAAPAWGIAGRVDISSR
jgi:hypothetical protein